jgi:asparagine N-glycosylation enzyme membrane subunit Stt3
MNFSIAILDVAPSAGTIGLAAGATFFLIMLAVAYLAYRLLKRTVKTAIRIAIVLIMIAIAVIGGVSFYFFGGGTGKAARPTPTRPR